MEPLMRRTGAWILVLGSLWACDGAVQVPEGVLASSVAQDRGRALFVESCALCHGERADGRGPRRSALSGPAADFTNPNWRRHTSPGEVFQVIRKGLRGTSMPAWPAYDDEQTWDLVAYLWSVSQGTGTEH
jgi:mono/diheme cytochrome c family protein